jgi:hypothetical protein
MLSKAPNILPLYHDSLNLASRDVVFILDFSASMEYCEEYHQ